MGAELGILSRMNSHEEKLTPKSPNNTAGGYHCQAPAAGLPGGAWMWNPKQSPEDDDDDDSWEVRAFAEDTGNVMGATWPPRSYTCTFCRREFRSAQALGGHMNVHRRDRARLHQTHPPSPTTAAAAGSHHLGAPPTTTFIIPANSGLCFYQLPNPNGIFAATSVSSFDHAPRSASPYVGRGTLLGQPVSFQATSSRVSFPRVCTDNIIEEAAFDSSKRSNFNGNSNKRKDLGSEELDLELRLGHRSRKPTL